MAKTVILAAVIGAFVFGMTGDIKASHIVAVTGSMNSDGNLILVNQGGSDISHLSGDFVVLADSEEVGALGEAVGSTLEVNLTGVSVVTVTAYFDDGSSQVVFTRQF